MLLGNDNYTREDMPSMQNALHNPSHMYQSMQDTIYGALNKQAQAPVAMPNQAAPSNQPSQWNKGNK